MPTYRFPSACDGVTGAAPASVDLAGVTVPVDRDGEATFETDNAGAVRALARAHDVTLADLRVGDDADSDADSETCDVVKSDGDVCGRTLPCRYHSGDT